MEERQKVRQKGSVVFPLKLLYNTKKERIESNEMKQKSTVSVRQMCYMKCKNIIDRILGGSGLVVLSPIYLAIVLAIKAEDGISAPVFFSQKRIGIHKTYFQLYKFRSMKVDTPHDKPTHLLENPNQYITKTGHFLRKTSLDELPQLWNIVKGDMAVIGPRPALWNQDDLISRVSSKEQKNFLIASVRDEYLQLRNVLSICLKCQ